MGDEAVIRRAAVAGVLVAALVVVEIRLATHAGACTDGRTAPWCPATTTTSTTSTTEVVHELVPYTPPTAPPAVQVIDLPPVERAPAATPVEILPRFAG